MTITDRVARINRLSVSDAFLPTGNTQFGVSEAPRYSVQEEDLSVMMIVFAFINCAKQLNSVQQHQHIPSLAVNSLFTFRLSQTLQ